MLLTDLKPPLPNGSDCKCRRVVGHTQDDKPSVPALVIDPIGNSYPDRITPKVMVQHGPFPASPTAARVLEIAHQFETLASLPGAFRPRGRDGDWWSSRRDRRLGTRATDPRRAG